MAFSGCRKPEANRLFGFHIGAQPTLSRSAVFR
jgi:hypothetical protein